jgi:hypothetical protein
MQYVHMPEYQIERKAAPFTLDWFVEQTEAARPKAQANRIGGLNVRSAA